MPVFYARGEPTQGRAGLGSIAPGGAAGSRGVDAILVVGDITARAPTYRWTSSHSGGSIGWA
jgi:hypothetical protein